MSMQPSDSNIVWVLNTHTVIHRTITHSMSYLVVDLKVALLARKEAWLPCCSITVTGHWGKCICDVFAHSLLESNWSFPFTWSETTTMAELWLVRLLFINKISVWLFTNRTSFGLFTNKTGFCLFTNKSDCLHLGSLSKTFTVHLKQGREQHLNVNSNIYSQKLIPELRLFRLMQC
jgi:hypothetical protein